MSTEVGEAGYARSASLSSLSSLASTSGGGEPGATGGGEGIALISWSISVRTSGGWAKNSPLLSFSCSLAYLGHSKTM